MTDKSKHVPCACDHTLESEPASGTISLTGNQHEEPWVNERWIQALHSSALQAESAKVHIDGLMVFATSTISAFLFLLTLLLGMTGVLAMAR